MINDSKFSEVKDKLSAMLDDFFAKYSKSEADLWVGGKALQNSTRKKFWVDVWGDDWSPVYSFEKN